ncbi:MAG TPA: pitrilysin family protein [Alphaproteobacteria bacterium]|nr:pitrilysin family protein [Alphaproteobacteria bacterium]
MKRSRYLNVPRRRHWTGILFVASLTLCGMGSICDGAAADEHGIVRATLDNGLQVVIVRNSLAPVVATAVNYIVGADETPPGFPGMAHAQEHMMFRGNPGLTADQLASIGSVMGGSFNADTRQTVTQYFFTVPSEDLDVALHIESIRMRDVLDSEEAWVKERGAIEQEVAQDLSSPRYVLFTKLRAALFRGTPYEHDALGTRPSFQKTTGAMLKSFYDKWYAPNNAVLVVVGDLDPDATLAKVKELFGGIKSKKLPKRPDVRLQSVKTQSLTLKTDLPYSLHVIAFRMPGLDSPDYAAAEVLADVLNNQRGDLYGLVPQGKALNAEFAFDPEQKAGMGYSVVAFPADGDGKAAEKNVRAILGRIAREGVPADLVEAAKIEERRGAEFEKNSIEGLATVWSEAVAVDGLQSPNDDLARIEKVTVEDVNRVARKYIDLDHAITALLTPQGSGKPISSKGFGGQENISLGEAKPTPLPDWAESVLRHLAVPTSTVNPTVSTLANGITLIVQPEDVSDTVSVFGRVRNRPELQVPKGQEGLSQVLDDLFPYGTEHLDRIPFRQALDTLGADEEAGTDFSIQVLAENFDRGVELLADNELHPALPSEAFDIVKQQIASTIAGRLRSPSYLTQRAIRAALFPKDDPALREPLPETVSKLTIDDVRDYFKTAFRPDLTTIVVIGKVTPEAAKATIERHFGAWSAAGPKPDTTLPPVPPSQSSVTAVPDASRVQDRVTLSETVGLTRADPDYYALQLGNNVLGGSFYSTRLSNDLRKNAGLVYSVDSFFEVGKTRGAYFVQYACDPENVSKVHDVVIRELRAMQDEPVTADELQRAKALLLRRIPLSESSVDDIGRSLIERVALDLPLDEPTRAAHQYLELDAPKIQAAFAKWLRPDDLAVVSQGPAPN